MVRSFFFAKYILVAATINLMKLQNPELVRRYRSIFVIFVCVHKFHIYDNKTMRNDL